MQPVTQTLAILLAANQRAPLVAVVVEYPAPDGPDGPDGSGFIGNFHMGASHIIEGIKSLRIQQNEEPSSDTFDVEVSNGDFRYSPLRTP